MVFTRMRIAARLALGFGLVIAFLAIVAATSLVRLSEFNRSVEDLAAVRVPKLISVAASVESLLQTSRQMRDVLILDDEKQIKDSLGAVHRARQQRREQLEKLASTATAGKEKELVQALVDAEGKYGPHEEEFLKAGQRGDYAGAKDVMLERVRPAQLAYLEAIKKVSDHQAERSQREAADAHASYRGTWVLVSSLAVLAVLAGVILSVVVARAITRPLQRTVDVLRSVAAGDFTRRLDVDRRDEIGDIATAVNQAVDSISGALAEVRQAAGQAASASQQLSTASQSLSSGAQEQASSLEETAASLEEISSTVKQNADSSQQANQLATQSRQTAERGGEVVSTAVTAMGEITTASKKIAVITATIDEIAFQTNLLALNAAVEAARAGEQGRGFAVVAAEVRALAQRAAAAAKEIKGLIEDTVGKVQAGSDAVTRSGQTLEEIVTSVKRVTDIIAEIAAASREQTSGIDQVNRAVAQMDQVVQANAAQTEELSSTAQTMAAQAQQLQALVGRFELGDEHARAVPGAQPAAAPAGGTAPAASPARVLTAARRAVARPAPRARPERPVAPAAEPLVPLAAANGRGHHDGFEEF
jgi:methyl-accepting chemotaxis protein